MYRTICLKRMASTSHGQRRILKKSPPVQKYIRQAIESGTYPPDDDEQQERNRRKAPYGSNFRDLPIEYEILTLYPPIPPPPRIPKKQRGLREQDSHLPTEQLVKAYLQRYEQEQTHDLTEDEYYNRLLGIPPPSSSTAMGRKSALLNKAYAFAMRQYEIMRQDDNLSELESIELVNQLLQEEKKDERYASRTTAKTIQQWSSNDAGSDGPATDEVSANSTGASNNSQKSNQPRDDDYQDTGSSSSYPSILHSKPRAIEGMAMWSRRLHAVPYREWTIGASTALDHWIARSILEMDEDSWQQLLEGDSPEMLSRGRDIVTVRQSLFPETILDGSPPHEHHDQYHHEAAEDGIEQSEDTTAADQDDLSSQDKSIDELLASLGGFDEDYEDAKESNADRFWPSESVVAQDDVDVKVSALVDELQDWRQKNVESPYEQWSVNEKEDFATWLDTYVSTLASKREGQVDLVATRKALLDSPPIDKAESDQFWQQVRDETEAEILLQSIRKTGTPSPDDAVTAADRKARQAFSHFQHLPYNLQLQKLVDLGTLRPMLDEYTSESDRVKFLARYGEKLMEGVEMEHLVPDSDGQIRGDELGRWGQDQGIGAEERFRIERIKYGTQDFGTGRSQRARQMYHAWNTQKAGRARFEEIMFKKDRLGLRYNLNGKGKVRTSLQKELGK